MLLFCITFPIVLLVWIVYSSRDVMLSVGRWCIRRRYEAECSGDFDFDHSRNYLIIPNHPAIVDPLVLVGELHKKGVAICPLVDESFFSNAFVKHILGMVNAVRVPDFRKSNFRPFLRVRPTHRSAARRAKALSYSVLALLTAGENVLLYPSGHITANGREELGNRQLAFNAISQLPEGVQVMGVRIRGLFGSMWSRAGGVPPPPFVRTLLKSFLIWPLAFFRRRRRVQIYAENLTERVKEWSRLSRVEFDKRLEQWYNADLDAQGLSAETVT